MPRIVLTQGPSSLRSSHGVSESKKLDVCDLKHISPLPQDDSLVNRWGLWSTPRWCSRVQKWSKVVAGDRDMARPGLRLNGSTRRPCSSWI